MTRLDGVTCLFNYHVKDDPPGDAYAAMRNREVPTDLYVDYYSDDAVLLSVESDDESLSIEIPNEHVDQLIEELEEAQ